jgi:hypothetical protein
MSFLRRKSIALSILTLAVIAAGHSVAADDAPEAAKDESLSRDTTHGELEILNLTATPSMDALTFRGTARNPYDEPIDGIRLIMQVRSDSDPGSPELARAQKVLDAKLPPTAHTAFEIAVKISPSTLGEPGLALRAFAIQRGDEVLPRTPMWRE